MYFECHCRFAVLCPGNLRPRAVVCRGGYIRRGNLVLQQESIRYFSTTSWPNFISITPPPSLPCRQWRLSVHEFRCQRPPNHTHGVSAPHTTSSSTSPTPQALPPASSSSKSRAATSASMFQSPYVPPQQLNYELTFGNN
jgi:hypothetical protein